MHPTLRCALAACALVGALTAAPATAAGHAPPSASRLDDRILDPAARGVVSYVTTTRS
jgi:hypothetical protein